MLALADPLAMTSWDMTRLILLVLVTLALVGGYVYAARRSPTPFLNKVTKSAASAEFSTSLTMEQAFDCLKTFQSGKYKAIAHDSETGAVVISQPGNFLVFGIFYSLTIRIGQYHAAAITVHTYPKIWQRGMEIRNFQKKFLAVLQQELASSPPPTFAT